MTDHLTSIAPTGHEEIGTVAIMIGVTGTVIGMQGGITIVGSKSGKEMNAGAKIGAGRATIRIVARVDPAATAEFG